MEICKKTNTKKETKAIVTLEEYQDKTTPNNNQKKTIKNGCFLKPLNLLSPFCIL